MPLHKSVILRNPSTLQSANNFSRLAEMEVALSTYGSYVRGDLNRRGTVYVGADGIVTPVLLQGLAGLASPTPMSIKASGFTNFEVAGSLVGTGTAFADVLSVHFMDGYFWALGVNTSGAPKVVALEKGYDLYSSASGWTDRSADFTTGDKPLFLKRNSSGKLWCVVFNSGSNTIRLMSTTGVGSSFVAETAGSIGSATIPVAYAMNSTGVIHMVFYGPFGYRSINNGASWSAMTLPSAPIRDISYCKKSNRWCAISTAHVPFYSTNNGATWTNSTILGTSTDCNPEGAPSHLECLDNDGNYLLLVTGYDGTIPGITTFLSEDGGASWVLSQVLRVPNYGTAAMPSEPQTVLINSNRVFLYQCATSADWNFDNSCFVTPLTNFSNL